MIYFVLFTGIINISCGDSKYFDNRPEICNKVFNNPPVNENTLRGYSVEDLLTLQKCGLAYYPEYQLSFIIANQDEYPVPSLIKHLQNDEDEYYQYHLILTFVALTESEKHRKDLVLDRYLILMEIDKAISKMNDKSTKSLAKPEVFKIKEFFNAYN